jgi:hypothetical protein
MMSNEKKRRDANAPTPQQKVDDEPKAAGFPIDDEPKAAGYPVDDEPKAAGLSVDSSS